MPIVEPILGSSQSLMMEMPVYPQKWIAIGQHCAMIRHESRQQSKE